MNLRPFVSVVATVATFLGLTGLSSPAFAAAPTVTFDSSASGCGAVTDVTFDGQDQTEYFATYWASENSAIVRGTILCGTNTFNLEWQDIMLEADAEVTLTVPNMSDISVTAHSGNYDTDWGAECINSDYPVGAKSFASFGSSGDPASPLIAFEDQATIAGDGSFTLSLVDNVQINLGYPFQDDSGDFVGAPDADAGYAFYEKCRGELINKLETTFVAGEEINFENKTAAVEYDLNFPDGFDSTGCTATNTESFIWVYRGQDTVGVSVACGEYGIDLESDFRLTAGQTNTVPFDVPAYEIITISGTVNFSHDECATSSLALVNSASWQWYRAEAFTAINDDGTFTFTGPAGVFSFQTVSNLDDGDQAEYASRLCAITSSAQGFIGEDTTGMELENDTVKVTVNLTQPTVNDADGDCSLYYPGTPEVLDTEVREFAVLSGATKVRFDLYCSDSYSRSVESTFTAVDDHTATANYTAPDLKLKTITGSIVLPKGYPASKIRDLQVSMSPQFDVASSVQGAYQSELTPTINKTKLTYTVTLPEGTYIFGIHSSATRSSGCYVDSYYPGGTVQFAQPVNITSSTGRAPTLQLLLGGHIRGHATFDESIPSGVSFFDDAVYTPDGTSFAWFAGDATTVQENGNFQVYQCLPAGKYYYQAGNSGDGVKKQFYGGVSSMENASFVTIPEGGADSERIEMHFTALDAGELSGTVFESDGDPAAGVSVVAYDELSDSFSSSETDADGNYVIKGLNTPGQYTVLAMENEMWFGTEGADYAYFPSNAKEDAVAVLLTKGTPAKSVIDIRINPDLPSKVIYQLWPWYSNMHVPSPAEDFDGVTEALLDGTVTVDIENVQTVAPAPIPRPDGRTSARLDNWQFDVDVNFNSVDDNSAGAYGFTGGDSAIGLGDVPAVDDHARVLATLDLVPGLNFVTVTGSDSGKTVAVPVIYGTLVPTQLTVPELNGVTKAGKTVQATAGVWVANPAVTSTKYQWMSCTSESTEVGCKPIAGAKKAKFTIPANLKRKFIALRVTASNGSETTVAIENFGRVR